MKNWMRRLAWTLAVVCCFSLLAGCGETRAEGTLAVCVGGAPQELDPIYTTNPGDQTILMHLYENLMRPAADASGSPTAVSGVAKSVRQEENDDGTETYTFKLRGAHWSDGRSVKASDFVFAWQRLADPAMNSPYAQLLSIVAGYDTVRKTGDVSALQVTAKNDTTLVVVLTGRYEWFLTQVCTAPATLPLRQDIVEASSEETEDTPSLWWQTSSVTNGPYVVETMSEDAWTLTASERYVGTQNGPSELTFRFADTPEDAKTLYDEKTVDFVWRLTNKQLEKRKSAENWTPVTELGVTAVLFNCQDSLLADPQVRRAMSLVIDRTAAAQAAGVSAQAAEGLIPAGVPEGEDGDFRTTAGALLSVDPEAYEDICAQARVLLEEAGGPPEGLEYLYTDTAENQAVAEQLCEVWEKELGIQVTPKAVSHEELQAALASGEYTLANDRILPVGNDAECYLMNWTSDSETNTVLYENSAYDTLLAIIAGAADGTARMGCLHDAEELLLEEAAVAPLYTNVTAWELREMLVGVERDARGWFSFTGVTQRSN